MSGELDGDKALVSTSPTGSEYTGWFWQSDLTPVENAPALRVGAKVRYHGRLYASSTGNGPGRTVDGTFTVTRILPDRVTGVLLDNGLGWVSADALSWWWADPLSSVPATQAEKDLLREAFFCFSPFLSREKHCPNTA